MIEFIIVFDIIKVLVCLLGAVLMTRYFLSETKKMKIEYNNPESKIYQSREVAVDLKSALAVYVLGMVCLIAIMIVVTVL